MKDCGCRKCSGGVEGGEHETGGTGRKLDGGGGVGWGGDPDHFTVRYLLWILPRE